MECPVCLEVPNGEDFFNCFPEKITNQECHSELYNGPKCRKKDCNCTNWSAYCDTHDICTQCMLKIESDDCPLCRKNIMWRKFWVRVNMSKHQKKVAVQLSRQYLLEKHANCNNNLIF